MKPGRSAVVDKGYVARSGAGRERYQAVRSLASLAANPGAAAEDDAVRLRKGEGGRGPATTPEP